MESRGRKYGVLFWLVVLPLTVVFLLALSSQKPGRWFQDAWMEEPVLAGAWQVFLFMQGVAVLPVYASAADSPQALVRAGKRGFLLAAAGNVVLYLLLTGVFGTATLGVMEHGALTLTALVKIPGGFLERQDALLCGIWLLSVYAFVDNAMGIMAWCLGGWSGCADRERPVPEGHGVSTALAAFALALCICIVPNSRDILWRLYRRLAVPVLVAVPVAGGILMKWNSVRKEGKP
jgi:hypothetical protein